MKHSNDNNKPLITVGMPLYNADEFLVPVLESLVNQSFKNFELIISDNASTDGSAEICKSYAAKDARIKYIRQAKNIGGAPNFEYVFKAATGEYYMWAAADDIRSSNYLELNYNFLKNNPSYSASGSPNGFENWTNGRKLVDFSLEKDNEFERYMEFFQNSFQSHGLFYCLFRTQILRDSDLLELIFPGDDWLGFDWATILYLASKGKINRTKEGNIIFGVKGTSSSQNIFRLFNDSVIEYFIPFYKLSKFVVKLSEKLTAWQRLRILYALIKLNVYANVEPLYQSQKQLLYRIYCRSLKPIMKFL